MKRFVALVLAALLLITPALAADTDDGAPGLTLVSLFHNGSPMDIVAAGDGDYFITDAFNKVVWRYAADGTATVAVGRLGIPDAAGVPLGGYNDAEPAKAAFGLPWGITPFLNGYLVSDTANNVVRYFDDTSVFTAVGSGTVGLENGRGVDTQFNHPTGLTTDAMGNAYVADTGNHVIRRISTLGQVTTFAGTGTAGYQDGATGSAQFDSPTGLCWYDGALYVADSGNHVIRRVEGERVTTFAGKTLPSGTDAAITGDWLDGAADAALFASPMDLAMSEGGVLYVSDSGNAAIRAIENGVVSTYISGDPDRGDPYPVEPRGLLVSELGLLVCDTFAGVVFTDTTRPYIMPFDDVNASDWFYGDVSFAAKRGLFSGTSATTFSPNSAMTRGMLVTVLGRMADVRAAEYTDISFEDVPAGSYYAPYIEWAFSAGIARGTGEGAFAPDRNISRQDLAVLLAGYAASQGIALRETREVVIFNDSDAISAYALDAVAQMVRAEIMTGRPGDLFDPLAGATRAEVAAVLHRFMMATIR